MAKIDSYLSFNGNCREAMTFYQSCLGGKLTVQTVAESPAAAQLPASAGTNVMHASLTNGNLDLMASDMMDEAPVQGNTISLILICESEEEINRFFNALSKGGKVISPVRKEFWGAMFGQLTDKFGFNWMLNYDKP